jgi:hypothetical protein
MNLLRCLAAFVLVVFGTQEQRSTSSDRPSPEFVVVEARFEEPTSETRKKLAEIDAALKAGKITIEQGEKRRSLVQKGQNLLLFGYFGAEARVIEVNRADAESVGWNEKAHPARIRFEKIPAVRGESRHLDTPLCVMPRKGWEASEAAGLEAKYRLHPWLQQPGLRSLTVSLPASIKVNQYVPASSGRVSTAVGSFSTGRSPAAWIVAVSFKSDQNEPFVGLFELVDSTGKSLGQVEIERPLQPGEARDLEMTLYKDPAASQGLRLQSVTARTSRVPGGPTSNPTREPK